MPRDDIHNEADMSRMIRDEFGHEANLITTPFKGRVRGISAGQTEATVARTATEAAFATPQAAIDWGENPLQRLDYRAEAELSNYSRLKTAVQAAERTDRFR